MRNQILHLLLYFIIAQGKDMSMTIVANTILDADFSYFTFKTLQIFSDLPIFNVYRAAVSSPKKQKDPWTLNGIHTILPFSEK